MPEKDVKVCPICGQPVKVNKGEENAKVYHMVCLENAMKTVVISEK